jgi:hypothetical protein
MGCTPQTPIKDKKNIAITNVKPSNKLIQNTSLDKIVANSRLTQRDLDEIGRYDIVIQE